jgi:hypothetical protein
MSQYRKASRVVSQTHILMPRPEGLKQNGDITVRTCHGVPVILSHQLFFVLPQRNVGGVSV